MRSSQKHGLRLRHMAIAMQVLVFGVFASAWSSATPLAIAESSAPTYLKLVFSAEGRPLVTSACLSVVEHRYPNTPWWSKTTSDVPNSGAERALRSVIAAFLAKDREALVQLSEPSSREGATFERQTGAYFEQFSELTIKSIPRSVRIDDSVVFFLSVDFHGKTSEAPLVFKEAGPDKVWFLPSPPQSIEYAIAKDWIKGADGPVADTPSCSTEGVGNSNVRLPLTSVASTETSGQSYLYLQGSSIVSGAPQSAETKRVLAAFDKLKQVLPAYKGDAPLTQLDSLGARRLQQWWSTADANERRIYVEAIVSEQPFFVFDLHPLFVLFTRSGKGSPHVLYFTPDSGGGLLWTNSSYGSTFDLIFKTGPLYDSAAPEAPFKAWLRPGPGAGGGGGLAGFEKQSDVRLASERNQGEVLDGCCK